MILTHDVILQEIEAGNIVIDPYDPANVGPASVDLHIGNVFRRFVSARHIVDIKEDTNYEALTELVHVPDGASYLLLPGETILALTRERICLGPGLCGWLEGRSRFARLGLLVHISASFMAPGIENKQALEISNFSPMVMALYPGTKICQFIFQRTEGAAKYSGRFSAQDETAF